MGSKVKLKQVGEGVCAGGSSDQKTEGGPRFKGKMWLLQRPEWKSDGNISTVFIPHLSTVELVLQGLVGGRSGVSARTPPSAQAPAVCFMCWFPCFLFCYCQPDPLG